uniref:HIG1 domain-containing protein n=1 Tax=Trieres chinensis TaxID=1514140 RepID=A0A7S2EXZ1_TRICV|mmetsp:Transcript_6924/g.14597  ORF Transcript_6924/g.14597 Transcript_6924/m.14597 type:complete len:373 (+) Transcript_6924:183-1301(+)|eukprot:CAMPEP_0183290768 /NCGR_PEP_ID=MMETSP0160_2-20130417/366_1 /TAXON_ID=2839 ORGANISM="Odontella Sinensis, Strain Grunow 1884" /NCGR_SAMPLE_ID=MMETSP0160_2 /ASSEMBLY_ACC=CAM_ASM_000250 /LENGTH=372 /DNA_ID=CAMNT_0025451425 /DNA_START=95 /DNA_END=1213 /DNA_ORIENTATION=+
MPSLTPIHKSEETADAAFREGVASGILALIPSGASVYYAMHRYPNFVRATNWQSRTALVVMPALFVFALSSETKLNHRMKEMAEEMEHGKATAEWAEMHRDRQRKMTGGTAMGASDANKGRLSSSVPVGKPTAVGSMEAEKQLTELYRQSVMNSDLRIVPGDSLGPHHRMSNFFMDNPFKILAAVGVPTVLYIFKGRNEKAHLQLQSKIMHTRIFGQFAVVGMLLSLMGFKEYMNANGRFVSEAEAEGRVQEMVNMRTQLLEQLNADRQRMVEREKVLQRAHAKDLERLGHQKKDAEDLRSYGVLEGDIENEEAEALTNDAEWGSVESTTVVQNTLKTEKKRKKKKRAAKVEEEKGRINENTSGDGFVSASH